MVKSRVVILYRCEYCGKARVKEHRFRFCGDTCRKKYFDELSMLQKKRIWKKVTKTK